MNRYSIFFSILIGFLPFFSVGQEVSSQEYDDMLQTILKRDVPEVDVATAAASLDD